MIPSGRRLRLCTGLIAANLLFIWGNSLLPGEVSGEISDAVKEFLAAMLPGDGLESSGGGFLIRKLAHFTEFACLGGLMAWRAVMLQKQLRWALPWGVAAACVDETIQRFTPGRGPSPVDVLIDSSGVAVGILLFHLGHHYFKKNREDIP